MRRAAVSTHNNSGNTSLNKTRALEWCLATLLLVWGWSVLEPGAFFDTTAVYKIMLEIATESRWGSAAVLIALMRFVGLGINGWWFRSPLIRGLGTCLSLGFWLAIGFFMYVSARQYGAQIPLGVRYYAVFSAFELWCVAAAAYDIQRNRSLSYAG